jgi:transketolase
MHWPYPPFAVPQHVFSAWRLGALRGVRDRQAWERRFQTLPAADREQFRRTSAGALPDGWEARLEALKRQFATDRPAWATRKASGETLTALLGHCPEIIGGAADLSDSIGARTKASRAIQAEDFDGNFIHFGVREQGMAALLNGLALHGGFVPYGGTFLAFADYMRAGIRMSALMEQRVVYVLSHDSIGVGEDGPTHQPVETLASLRAIPNLRVFRPADAVETVECWAAVLAERQAPSCLILSRQNLPAVRTGEETTNRAALGAYVLAEPDTGRDVTLLATGSEVGVAVEAAEILATEGIRAAVVSMPCWELFEQQPLAYRRQVLGTAPRVGVEAAIRQGWDRWLGDDGLFVGMAGFGLSAPAAELFRHFGITTETVVEAARTLAQGER